MTVECTFLVGSPAYFLYDSNDDGAAWKVFPIPGGQVDFFNESVGFLLSNEKPAQLFKTLGGGRTCTAIATVGSGLVMDFVNAMVGWALESYEWESALMATYDGGVPCGLLSPQLIVGE